MTGRPLLLVLSYAVLIATSGGATLVFEGLRRFPEEKAREALKDQWQDIESRGLTPSRANDAGFFLKLALRQEGFADSDVVAKIVAPDTLRLIVEEGEPLWLGEIRLLGVHQLDASLLEEAMRSETKKRQSLMESASDLPFVRSSIVNGVKAIEGYAHYEGFLTAEATLESVGEPNAEGRVDVVVRVVEGPAYKIAAIELTGIEGRLFAKLNRLAEPYVGKPLNVANMRALPGELLKALHERGYFDAAVEVLSGQPEDVLTQSDVVVELAVHTGVMYRITEVRVSGNEDLPESFVAKRFERLLEKPYDPVEINKIYREFIQTGIYDTMEVNPVPLGDGLMAVEVVVEEAEFRNLGFFGGFGSFDGAILGTSYTNRNLFGYGREFRSHLEWNSRGIQGKIDYLDRWFLDSRWRFGIQLFTGSRDLPGYEKWQIGILSTLSYPLTEHSTVSLYGGFTHVSLTENSFVDVDIGPEDYQVQLFGASYSWDHQGDLETRGHGYIFEASLDYATSALVGDVSFVRGQMRLAHYWQLPKNTELRLGIRGGAMQPLGDQDVIPVDLRFFSGGSRTVRSFPERELGPEDARHHPTGGEFFTTFNAEYSIPLRDSFLFAIFADAGNLLGSIDEISLDEMHYAAGVGLRYDLPVGPLRMDYGFNLNRSKGEPKGSFHIGFGFAF